MQSPVQKPFFLTLSLFALIWTFFIASPVIQTEIESINQKIEELAAMKRGYDAKALRHEDYAQRLQFNNGAYLETRRHIMLAEEYREKARIIQIEINQLESRKKVLMEKNARKY